jgi:hypothetical protein
MKVNDLSGTRPVLNIGLNLLFDYDDGCNFFPLLYCTFTVYCTFFKIF